jgi:hypothetical protein
MTGPTDSAGVPWAGRSLAPQPFAGDDGSADPALVAALETGDAARVAAALAAARVLVPVVAVLGDDPAPVGPMGLPVDKAADMAVATLVAPDGARALPVFTSLATLGSWDATVRPVPAEGQRAALAAVQDECTRLVVDPAGPVPAVVARPVLWALAQGRRWVAPAEDVDVLDAVRTAVAHPAVTGVACGPMPVAGLRVELAVRPGLDAAGLSALAEQVRMRLAASEVLAERVDALDLRLVPAGPGPSSSR